MSYTVRHIPGERAQDLRLRLECDAICYTEQQTGQDWNEPPSARMDNVFAGIYAELLDEWHRAFANWLAHTEEGQALQKQMDRDHQAQEYRARRAQEILEEPAKIAERMKRRKKQREEWIRTSTSSRARPIRFWRAIEGAGPEDLENLAGW